MQVKQIVSTCFHLFIVSHIIFVDSCENQFIPPRNTDCICLGDVLTFTCTVFGGGTTQWGGNIFDCEDKSNQIVLRHTQFSEPGGTSVDCSGGAISGRSVSGDASTLCYTSKLDATVNSGFSSRITVNCSHNSNTGRIAINESSVSLLSEPYPPPSDIYLADVSSNTITFNWTLVAPECSSVLYNITSSACGTCPNSTDSTTFTCSNFSVPSLCTVSVQTTVCDLFTGNASKATVIPLKLPESPLVQVIPHYFNDNQSLTTLTLLINQTLIEDVRSMLRTQSYKVSYETSSTSNFNFTSDASCVNEACEYVNVVAVPQSLCSSSANVINVTVSAISLLGTGPPSEYITAGCKSFIKVEYDSLNATLSCVFTNNHHTASDSVRSCSVRYGKCGGELPLNVPTMSTLSNESSNVILLQLESQFVEGNPTFCYAVTANNGTHIIIVEGQISASSDESVQSNSIIVIAITVPIVIMVILVAVVAAVLAAVVIMLSCGRRRRSTGGVEEHKNIGED